MAGATLFTLLDDLASLLDDVATLTKVATRKTGGVLGDDLALNAEQVSGVSADRELPVVWAVARKSLLNKALLVPAALAISAFAPWLITPLLMIGGAYLCFEGVEKLVGHPEAKAADTRTEAEKIAGAVRTDFVLSAEIVVIALGSVAGQPLVTQLGVLAALSLLLTVGVYGLVGGIVKLDDWGLAWSLRGRARRAVGLGILWVAPRFMKALSVVGTLAMFLVGGGILVHGVHPVDELLIGLTAPLGLAGPLLKSIGEGLFGALAGAVVLGVVTLVRRVASRVRS
jgi:predicted DNA repair protein MutK